MVPLNCNDYTVQKSWADSVEGRAEVHYKDPVIGSCWVQVLEGEVEGHVHRIVYRPVGTTDKLQDMGGLAHCISSSQLGV